ncbi:hypothetical protein RRG08_004218 [Elysia crispata]|uniref:Uncharacterized protein n=1 Tax=Elysia crispata TaxID=231223 RepID=A0AAE1DHA1_9GAST|nr:hypothetical protein RRG08_004218 [Elysia crispata]
MEENPRSPPVPSGGEANNSNTGDADGASAPRRPGIDDTFSTETLYQSALRVFSLCKLLTHQMDHPLGDPNEPPGASAQNPPGSSGMPPSNDRNFLSRQLEMVLNPNPEDVSDNRVEPGRNAPQPATAGSNPSTGGSRPPSNTTSDTPAASSQVTRRPRGNDQPSISVVVRNCAVCRAWATGEHYGAYTCIKCKQFFCRTVSREITYAECVYKNCMIGRVKRKRCNYCRYTKCLSVGMKREAVNTMCQPVPDEDTDSSVTDDLPHYLTPIAELFPIDVDSEFNRYDGDFNNLENEIGLLSGKYLFELVDWARQNPFFMSLPFKDKVVLLRYGWRELFIACMSYRSVFVEDNELYVSPSLRLHRTTAEEAGVGVFFDRIYQDIVVPMREICLDETEIGLLQNMILLNPDADDLTVANIVENHQIMFCLAFEQYYRLRYVEEYERDTIVSIIQGNISQIAVESGTQLAFFRLMRVTPYDDFLVPYL